MSKRLIFVIIMGIASLSACAKLTRSNIDTMVHGSVAPGFEDVREEFINNFLKRGELGASVAVYYRGEKVVDLWGGYRDDKKQNLWQSNTMALVWSATKGVASLTLAKLHSDGYLDYDEKVAYYWPEFAQSGKENITVRQLISHQAGLLIPDAKLDVTDLTNFDRVADIIAKMTPMWTPGEYHGYHASTEGNFLQELVRCTDPRHRSLGRYFADEFARPLELDFYIGLPDSIPNERIAKIKELFLPGWMFHMRNLPKGMRKVIMNSKSLFWKSMTWTTNYNVNERATWRIEQPAGNGIGTARAMARVYSVFANGGKELNIKDETIRLLFAPPVLPTKGKMDQVMNFETEYHLGICPFYMSNNIVYYGAYGASGACGFADPEHKIGFAYIPNKMDYYGGLDDWREVALRKALYRCVERIENK